MKTILYNTLRLFVVLIGIYLINAMIFHDIDPFRWSTAELETFGGVLLGFIIGFLTKK